MEDKDVIQYIKDHMGEELKDLTIGPQGGQKVVIGYTLDDHYFAFLMEGSFTEEHCKLAVEAAKRRLEWVREDNVRT